MDIQEKIDVMQAYQDGADIQFWSVHEIWIDIREPNWNFETTKYRKKATAKEKTISKKRNVGV